MELLLNLAWLLLALPAYWLWRRDTRKVNALQCLLALASALVLLFPVISASDDLHAMRAEMEDSSINKRTVRQAIHEKNSAHINRLQGPPATIASAARLIAPELGRLDVFITFVSPAAPPCVFYAGRAPPFSLLA